MQDTLMQQRTWTALEANDIIEQAYMENNRTGKRIDATLYNRKAGQADPSILVTALGSGRIHRKDDMRITFLNGVSIQQHPAKNVDWVFIVAK